MRTLILGILLAGTLAGCKKDDATSSNSSSSTTTTTTTTTTSTDSLAVYKKLYGATSVTSDGTWVTITSTGVPDHKSAYFATGDAKYEAFSGTTFGGNTFNKNPNSITAKSYTFKIPRHPAPATTHAATPLGPIGVSLNGVPFFNQYAGPNQPLTNEVVSFDQGLGASRPGGRLPLPRGAAVPHRG